MSKQLSKHSSRRDQTRTRRRRSIRRRVSGTQERPRLAVFRSSRHIYAQVIDDRAGQTLAAVSTLSPELREQLDKLDKKGQAKLVGTEIAKRCLDKKIDSVVFDRGGFLYTGGRLSSLADAAREGGLKF